ncbi:MAG: hypothetical protein I8H77_12315 [Comamonadaceae bacterium]|nr:hypothetical protein [Comamonadaceae bacterium]
MEQQARGTRVEHRAIDLEAMCVIQRQMQTVLPHDAAVLRNVFNVTAQERKPATSTREAALS